MNRTQKGMDMDTGESAPHNGEQSKSSVIESLPPSESGIRTEIKLSGEVKCRAFSLLTGYEPPRAYMITDIGAFHIELGDAQIASFIEDGSAYVAKKLREAPR